LIHQDSPDYESALARLEANIEETPNASDADYDYGWAMVCCAKLGKYEETYLYYEFLRKHCYGWLTKGAGGANRNWESRCRQVRELFASQKDAAARAVATRMAELDEQTRARIRAETLGLVRQANQGDVQAAQRLQHARYHEILVELTARGELVPTEK